MKRKLALTLLFLFFTARFLTVDLIPAIVWGAIFAWGPYPVREYARRQLLAMDQLYNVATGGGVDETISSRTAKRRDEWPFNLIGWGLELIDPGHLRDSIEIDETAKDIL